MTDAAALQALRDLKAASGDIPVPIVSEIVLQTNQYELMKAWYEGVFAANWIAETSPKGPPQGDRTGVGGKQVFATDVRASFMRLPQSVTFAIFELTHLKTSPDKDPGINHMQVKYPDMETLIRRLEVLRDYGVHPHRSSNHGPATSFYFRDPDENIVELCVYNFESPAEMAAFAASPQFKANPSGVALDRDDFISRYRSGEPLESLLAM
ncbi:VOC family protein [Rhizorhabdus sp.]|jgi:catechol 2,3-dioxygenase-like lactoylglutathione lyase family enzyme|uniref:VOC family protein n=1 Tax=Rhizorhabdus sp. TaxID=1968843 RepID=UPI0019AD7228|nr:VOC family protein [Rhizorhabdus sp.]MBD3759592.1 VOC family protein [Rhizorhabdus sp.]